MQTYKRKRNLKHTEIKSFPEYEIIDQTYFKREHSKKYM